MACRSDIPGAGERVKELSKSQKVEMLPVDLSDVDAIRAFCAQLKERGETLDVVVLNAGVTPPTSNHTRQGQDRMFAVNYLANVILTRRLLASGVIPNETAGNRARKPPRIIFISSDSHQGASAIDFDEFGSTAPYGVTKAIHNYSYFKLVLNTYATELSRRLNRDGRVDVSVNVICPGPVNTDIIRDAPFLLRLVLRGIFTLVFQPPAKAALPVAFLAAAKAEGEGAWRMPLGAGYDAMLKSRFADMRNSCGREAGSITAVHFLKRFVKDETPWIHLDIAGVASLAKDTTLAPKGATGWGVMALNRLIRDLLER